jgi:hypothetical protein
VSTTPGKPLDQYPDAEAGSLPPPPPPGLVGEPQEAAAPAKAAAPLREVATLDFLDPAAVRREETFAYPFRLDGCEVRGFTARKLTLSEVGRIVEAMRADEDGDLIVFYEVMTGLPAPVIRGLIEEDGQKLVDACYPFLPRVAQTLISLQTPEAGDASR